MDDRQSKKEAKVHVRRYPVLRQSQLSQMIFAKSGGDLGTHTHSHKQPQSWSTSLTSHREMHAPCSIRSMVDQSGEVFPGSLELRLGQSVIACMDDAFFSIAVAGFCHSRWIVVFLRSAKQNGSSEWSLPDNTPLPAPKKQQKEKKESITKIE